MRQYLFLLNLLLVSLLKSHLEHVSSSNFCYSKSISISLFSSERSCVRMHWWGFIRYI
jgi:hypothetical protein